MSIRVFVYGSLMRGERNHVHIAPGKFLRETQTRDAYTLVLSGEYPGLIEGGRTTVAGELFEVSPSLLQALDEFEGHPTWYTRRGITLADGSEAQAYFLGKHLGDERVIVSGDWRREPR